MLFIVSMHLTHDTWHENEPRESACMTAWTFTDSSFHQTSFKSIHAWHVCLCFPLRNIYDMHACRFLLNLYKCFSQDTSSFFTMEARFSKNRSQSAWSCTIMYMSHTHRYTRAPQHTMHGKLQAGPRHLVDTWAIWSRWAYLMLCMNEQSSMAQYHADHHTLKVPKNVPSTPGPLLIDQLWTPTCMHVYQAGTQQHLSGSIENHLQEAPSCTGKSSIRVHAWTNA